MRNSVFLFVVLFFVGALMLSGCSRDHAAAKQLVEHLAIGKIVYEDVLVRQSIFLICKNKEVRLVVVLRGGEGSLSILRSEGLPSRVRCDELESGDQEKQP